MADGNPTEAAPNPPAPKSASRPRHTKTPSVTFSDAFAKGQTAIHSLSSIISTLPKSVTESEKPAVTLLHDPDVSANISSLLREPLSGSGDSPLCRWLYDTFQSNDAALQLVVLRYLPIIAGAYLARVGHVKSLAGFEAVLLALYAHEANKRNGQSVSVDVPDLSHPSVYHESKEPSKSNATDLNLAVISPSLEPYGTVRSTRRARIVGVALELYYSRISDIPVASKMDFCEFCKIWSGVDGEMYDPDEIAKGLPIIDEAPEGDLNEQGGAIDDDDNEKNSKGKEKENDERSSTELFEDADEVVEKNYESETEKGKEEVEEEKIVRMDQGRIVLPWELLQPVIRILGHCIFGLHDKEELRMEALTACRSLYARAIHDINPKAIIATQSLLKLVKITEASKDDPDPTEIPVTSIIVI